MTGKVAVVHDWLTGMRGGEKVLEGILELYPEADVFTLIHFPEKISPFINRFKVKTSFLQRLPKALKRKYAFLLPLMPFAIESFDLKGYDLVVSSSHCVAKAVKPEKQAKHVCYCHSPMRYAYDMFNAYFGEKNWLFRNTVRFFLHFIRQWDRATVNRVDRFVANSRNTANKIKQYYGREAVIINPPVDTEYFTPIKAKDKGFYLIVSALVPYKKVDLAVKAFQKLPGKRLVVIGSGVEMEHIKALAGENVELKGWSSDEEIKWHYQNCQAFLFPGEEDFGITALEAQSAGKPVIAFRKGGCLETVVEGKTGLFFDRQTPEELVKAVKAFEKKRFKASDCRKNALNYSKKAFKAKLKAFIEKC